MPLINLEGEREATTQNSEEYGKKIIDFLNLQGYHLEHDSNIEGIFQDKVFRNPKLDGNKKTVVEVKDTDLSLNNKDFLVEYGKYFMIYSREIFNLFIFAKKIVNINKWKKIFDLATQSEDEILSFYEDIKKCSSDKIDEYSIFKEFIIHTKIYQTTYDKLLQKIEQIKKDNIYDFEVDYLKDIEDLVYEPEILNSNLFIVKSFPDYIFKAKLKVNSFTSLWKNPFANSFVAFNGILYSIREFPENILSEYCDENTYNKFKFTNIDLESERRLVSQLIKSQIILNAFDNGFYYNRNKKSFYKPHFNLRIEKSKVKVEDEKSRVVSTVYIKDGNLNFVSHRAVKIEVTRIENEYYVLFNNYRLFTNDGKHLIMGEGAKKLNSKFAPTKAFNDAEKSKLFFLIKAMGSLRIGGSTQSKLDNSNPSTLKNQFVFEEVTFKMPCKSKKGEVFEENYDYEENVYSKISDYYDEE
ncbi:hypothetical protein [Methanolobus sp.]|uniref:hypothetical protein n=1 Tax=Methanolobus sp. TaxID=1874737 RepID=UPI0025FF8F8D|nr:hypothetical protein [Methanolobus sp.]